MLIDESPLRTQHGSIAHRLLTRFSSIRKKIAEFHDRDKPAFARWLAVEFYRDLGVAEALQARLVRVRHLAERIEIEREESRLSYHDAFRIIMEDDARGLQEDVDRAEEEIEDEEEDGPDFDEDAFESEDDEDGEQPRAGRTFDRESVDWAAYGPDRDPRDGARLRRERRAAAEAATPAQIAKDRYRKLVRLLHPDRLAEKDQWAEDLWHQTQTAFKARDTVQLDALLSIARLRFGEGRDRPLIGEVLSASAWLREALAGLAAELRRAKGDDAWSFSKLKDRSRLQRKIAYQIEDDIGELRGQVARFEAFLERCAQPARSRGSSGRRSSRASTSSSSSRS